MPITEEVIRKVAEDTGISVEELKVSSLLAFLREKKKKIMLERLDILARYRVNSPDNLEIKIKRWQNKLKGSKSLKGQFLRSADFDYKDFIKSRDLKIVYLLTKGELSKYKSYISARFYEFLEEKAK